MTLDFIYDGKKAATGIMTHNGELVEIACILSAGGETTIGYPSDEEKNVIDINDYIYSGYFKYKGKNKLILVVPMKKLTGGRKVREEYTFIMLDNTDN